MMNAVERMLDKDLLGLLDRVAGSIPEGGLAAGSAGTLKARLDEADARVAEIRATIMTEYGRWRCALDDLEMLGPSIELDHHFLDLGRHNGLLCIASGKGLDGLR